MTPSKDWIYCPNCYQEICINKCRSEVKKAERWECGNLLTGGYLDDYWYEKVIDTYILYHCPNDDKVLRQVNLDKHYTGEKSYR